MLTESCGSGILTFCIPSKWRRVSTVNSIVLWSIYAAHNINVLMQTIS